MARKWMRAIASLERIARKVRLFYVDHELSSSRRKAFTEAQNRFAANGSSRKRAPAAPSVLECLLIDTLRWISGSELFPFAKRRKLLPENDGPTIGRSRIIEFIFIFRSVFTSSASSSARDNRLRIIKQNYSTNKTDEREPVARIDQRRKERERLCKNRRGGVDAMRGLRKRAEIYKKEKGKL